MVSQRQASVTLLQGSWMAAGVAVAVLAVAAFSVPASARYLAEECPGLIGNREIYSKVSWLCEDCANLFRDNAIRVNCSRNCFFNDDFKTCVQATERHREMEQLARWVSILGAGRRR